MQKILKSIKIFQSYDHKCTATFFSVHSVYRKPVGIAGPKWLMDSATHLSCADIKTRPLNENIEAHVSLHLINDVRITHVKVKVQRISVF